MDIRRAIAALRAIPYAKTPPWLQSQVTEKLGWKKAFELRDPLPVR